MARIDKKDLSTIFEAKDGGMWEIVCTEDDDGESEEI